MAQRWTLILLAAFAGTLLLVCASVPLGIAIAHDLTALDHTFSITVLLMGCAFGLLAANFLYWRHVGMMHRLSNTWEQAGYITMCVILGIGAVCWVAWGIGTLMLFTLPRSILMSGTIVLLVLSLAIPYPLIWIGRRKDARTRQRL